MSKTTKGLKECNVCGDKEYDIKQRGGHISDDMAYVYVICKKCRSGYFIYDQEEAERIEIETSKAEESMRLVLNDKNAMMEIGNEVMSLWRGECTGYKVDYKNKQVVFDGIERGEKFCSKIVFADLPKCVEEVEQFSIF